MSRALFPPRATPVGRGVLIGLAVIAIAAPLLAMAWVRTPWARGEHVTIAQPIPFSHPLHAGTLHIDCRFCHSQVERADNAGLPPTDRCVTCHSNVWMATSTMAPIRASLAHHTPIPWRRVTQLPEFVYFSHAMHVNKGVGCETCHGRVDQMATVRQVAPLTMQWCVSCHRNPEPSLRPASAITTMGWSPASLGDSARAALVAHYQIHHYTTCSTCHR